MTTANGGTSHIVSGEAVSLFSRANLLGSVCRCASKTGDKLPLLRERMEARSHIPAVHVMNPSLAVMKVLLEPKFCAREPTVLPAELHMSS